MKRNSYLKYTASTTRVESPISKILQVSAEVARILLSALFIFSGFVKAIDPLGYTYKIEDYLTAFGGFFSELTFLAFVAAVFLSSFEFALGLCFLLKIKLKLTSIASLIFMGVMLPLTLYIALENPITDCGCFGDALVISNWATFCKNIVITVLIICVLTRSKRFSPLFQTRVEWVLILLFLLLGSAISAYSYRHLPMFDFRPYKKGTYIPEAMKIPEGKPVDKYDTKLVYEKNGEKKEFTLENYPKDSTWTFVEQRSTLIEKGYEPLIHDFRIIDEHQDDITDQLLHLDQKVYFLVMYDVNKSSEKGVKQAEEIYQNVLANGEVFYALTASPDGDIDMLREKTGVTFPFCKVDPITLKTIIRANPGIMTIENGTIIGKWNWRNFNKINY